MQAGAYSGFCSMKRLKVFLLPPEWDASLSKGYPQHYVKLFPDTHLYTWVERGTVTVKCLVQKQNAMCSVRARTRTARSGDERNKHEATARLKDVRAHCFCASLLRTKFTCHATPFIERAR